MLTVAEENEHAPGDSLSRGEVLNTDDLFGVLDRQANTAPEPANLQQTSDAGTEVGCKGILTELYTY